MEKRRTGHDDGSGGLHVHSGLESDAGTTYLRGGSLEVSSKGGADSKRVPPGVSFNYKNRLRVSGETSINGTEVQIEYDDLKTAELPNIKIQRSNNSASQSNLNK